jgi:hypothetical protein
MRKECSAFISSVSPERTPCGPSEERMTATASQLAAATVFSSSSMYASSSDIACTTDRQTDRQAGRQEGRKAHNL